jgi:ring-1,2-phenylacetyl-CoA epoxidase subunit PaaD
VNALAAPAKPEPVRLTRARAALEAVPDPEIPVVSIRELGILRDVRIAPDDVLEVVITPTYSGCPAMYQITEDIGHALDAAELGAHRVVTVLAPAWSTDWITAEARVKLKDYGIAPPGGTQPAGERVVRFVGTRPRHETPEPGNLPAQQKPQTREPGAPTSPPRAAAASPACPRCGSADTELLAQFGSTACKALYRCCACREPFDYFKPY